MEEYANESNSKVMCVGHNRGWEEAASGFCGQEVSLASASAALLQIEAASWEEACHVDQRWTLVGVVKSTGVDLVQ